MNGANKCRPLCIRLLAYEILFQLAAFQAARAATLEWSRQFGTTASDLGLAISADRLGNIFIVGRTQGSHGSANADGDDVFVAKFDAAGQMQWKTQFGTVRGEMPYGISADGLGNAYVTGVVYLSGSANPYVPPDHAFISKIGAAGNIEWSRDFPKDYITEARGVSADGLGNVYVSGHSPDSPGILARDIDAFLTKFDILGNEIWTRKFGSTAFDSAFAVSADRRGNVFVTGLGGIAGPDNTTTGLAAFIGKFDGNGTQHWLQRFGSDYIEQGLAVSADGKGNAYVAGASGGRLEPIVKPTITSLTKFDEAGSLQWFRTLDAGYNSAADDSSRIGKTMGVAADPNGFVYFSGYTPTYDMYLTKYDELGNKIWTQIVGTASQDASPGVSTDGAGNVYITGYTAGSFAGPNAGSTDVVLVKFADAAVPEPTLLQSLLLTSMACFFRRPHVAPNSNSGYK